MAPTTALQSTLLSTPYSTPRSPFLPLTVNCLSPDYVGVGKTEAATVVGYGGCVGIIGPGGEGVWVGVRDQEVR